MLGESLGGQPGVMGDEHPWGHRKGEGKQGGLGPGGRQGGTPHSRHTHVPWTSQWVRETEVQVQVPPSRPGQAHGRRGQQPRRVRTHGHRCELGPDALCSAHNNLCACFFLSQGLVRTRRVLLRADHSGDRGPRPGVWHSARGASQVAPGCPGSGPQAAGGSVDSSALTPRMPHGAVGRELSSEAQVLVREMNRPQIRVTVDASPLQILHYYVHGKLFQMKPCCAVCRLWKK